LFVLQSNNYKELQQHINCVENLAEFEKQYQNKLQNIRAFELEKEKYTRFMIMGVKK